jgi:hypothetical protein
LIIISFYALAGALKRRKEMKPEKEKELYGDFGYYFKEKTKRVAHKEKMGSSIGSNMVANARVWKCPKCKAILEKGALGIEIFIGECVEKIYGMGMCPNCGAAFSQSQSYGGKYDYIEPVKGIKKSSVPDKLSLIIFRTGQDQPPNPRKYCEYVLKKAYGVSDIKLDAWRIAGTRSSIGVSGVKALYSMGKTQMLFPDFGKPD